MERMTRKEAIDKIVVERGTGAVLPLLELLQKCEDDEQTADIIIEVLINIGHDGMPAVRNYLNVMLKRYSEGYENWEQEYSPFCMLYVAEVVGEIGESKDIKLLNDMTVLYDSEEAVLIIYESIAKLGGGDQLIQLMDFYVFEDSYKEQHVDQCVMILANIASAESVSILVKSYGLEWIKEDTRELIKNAVSKIIIEKPELISVLESGSRGKDILREITFEDHGDELN